MKRLFEFLSGLPTTLVGGVFLAASLALMLLKIEVPVYLNPAWAAVIICGYPLLYLAVRRVFVNKGMSKISSALLISIAMIASIAIGELFAAGEVAFIMAIGGILEEKTVARAQKGLKQLISLQPAQGRRIVGGKEETVPIAQVALGDVLRVLPGEAIPVDGEILSGNTSVDQSIITGESLPVDKSVGDSVFCGTINRFGSVDIRATKVGEDSSLQKLIRMVKEAENNKAPMQRIVDKWAAWLVPAALLIAIATYLITRDITRAVTILVVFCPCALALATPTSIMAAIGQATKHGVIIKSGDALECMGKVDCVAFDKTGTLTHGSLYVSDVEGDVLQLAASLERYSEHPIAKAIVEHYDGECLAVENFLATPGVGVEGNVAGRRVVIGRNIEVTVDGAYAGKITVKDRPKASGAETVKRLLDMGVRAVMLTGDNRQTANEIAAQAGIENENVYAGLLPAQKVEMIRQLQQEGRSVCMIGDGVNDAPALKTADVGVAMGGMGSDIAVEAADIALMGDDISKIPYLKRLSKATVRLIKFNISLSMGINLAAIVLSVLALLNPITGALVHNAGSVLVVLNAALLYDRKYT
ncbi:MAG: cadmium-translocating P-type ATPase [Firmicutes bacterium]|nr:cadmium-translocating P-type ATPase [Bacillota bacterium]